VRGGGAVSNQIAQKIRAEVRDLTVAEAGLPLWTTRGLSDHSCTIHSTGITYWNLIGQALGFVAIGELPAPQNEPYAYVGGDVRSDSVWFDAVSFLPVALVEFERYSSASDEAKLMGKVENLLLGYHRWQQKPSALVLAYWTKGHLTLPQHETFRKRIRRGFETAAKERVRGTAMCDVFFIQTILTETADGRWRLSQLIERGL